MSMHDFTRVNGTTQSIGVSFLDTDGSAYDMSNKFGLIRLSRSTQTGVEYTRLTSTAAQFTWGVQASGTGTWLWKSNETHTVGVYKAEAFIYDASSPIVRRKVGEATYTIVNPETGSW